MARDAEVSPARPRTVTRPTYTLEGESVPQNSLYFQKLPEAKDLIRRREEKKEQITRENRTWAGVLDLPQNPDSSGFASRFFWKHRLPGLADSHVRETVSFPDLLIRMRSKRLRCW